jgi:hypothetical protein
VKSAEPEFAPHAILITEREQPSPLLAVAMIGAEKLLRIDFDYSKPEAKWVDDICRKLPNSVVAFGNVTGFVVNYAPDKAKAFDRDGRFTRELSEPRRPKIAKLAIDGAEITSDQWSGLTASRKVIPFRNS